MKQFAAAPVGEDPDSKKEADVVNALIPIIVNEITDQELEEILHMMLQFILTDIVSKYIAAGREDPATKKENGGWIDPAIVKTDEGIKES